jgi:outer membrane autotransporter protein
VSVAAAGTLGGTGTVVGQVTNNGIVAPGNSVGTLSVTGDVAFAAGSSLAIEVDGTGVDLLDVDGNVTVDPAASLDMTFQAGAVDVQGARVAQATGSIDAAFATVNTNDTLVAVSLVGGNSLELDVVGVASVNAAVAASAEEGFSFQNAVAGAQLSPRAAGSATPLWVRGVSEAGPAEGGVQQAINGVLFGGDVASFSGGALRLGVAGGYVSSDAQALVGSNSSAAEGLQAGTYGTYDLSMPGGATQLTFGLHGGYQTQETERAVVVGDTRTVGRGETRGSLMGGYVGASREFALGDHLTLRPGARLGYLHQELEGYRDSAGLRVGALSADSLRFGPQVELSGDYETAGGITFKPRGQVGWSQQMALDDRSVRLTLPSGAGGKVALDDGNAGSLNVAFGLDMVFEPGTSAYLSFDGTYASAQTRTSAFAGLSFDLW